MLACSSKEAHTGTEEPTDAAAPVAAAATLLNAFVTNLLTLDAPSSAFASSLSDWPPGAPDLYVFHSDRTEGDGSLSGADFPVNHPVKDCMIGSTVRCLI